MRQKPPVEVFDAPTDVSGVSRDLSCKPGKEATRLGGRADPVSEMRVYLPRSCRHAPSPPAVRRCAIVGIRKLGRSRHAVPAPIGTFGLILAAKDCATIFPFRTTNVSVANSYELSAVSAVQTI